MPQLNKHNSAKRSAKLPNRPEPNRSSEGSRLERGMEMPVRLPKISILAIASITLMATANTDTIPVAKESYTVPLSGAAEATLDHPEGGAGDLDGAGSVRLAIDESKQQICYKFKLSGLATPLMAHIHRGHPHQIGPTVVTLFTGMDEDLSRCVLWTNKQLAAIVADPSDYYVNVYTTEYPDGALRGQLAA
ncbi:CHRD domain-containing protein [Sphingomonas hankyongi]|uniref:CHRD domain-containing protein n=1 Tax=Sphingomonas hankyongi TaxID=2908209 RepID=A0ABT0RYD9_9SPHN|nr:CHRD domain-containing protein [Sphingomonas hankyongi]MCL6728577.1 CHRD domain-containing protein [Sphingomonas hankyongi]